ncbi:MAG: zinc ribbon domain-containing protein [candidate division WOR-3 bacterium]
MMPVYEYKCEDCDKKFEVVASIVEKEAGLSPVCPKCGGMRVRQVFSRFTVIGSSKSEDEDFDDNGSDIGEEGGGLDDYEDYGDEDWGEDEDLGEGFDDEEALD